jgi:hypothetical protein
MPNQTSVSLKVDLGDPDSIRKKIPEVEEMVAIKRRVAAAAQADFETWNELLAKFRSLAGLVVRIEETLEPNPYFPPVVIDAVVKAVERADRRIMGVGVRRELIAAGHEVESPAAAEAALVAAAAAGRLQEVEPKVFAPNSLLIHDLDENTEMTVVPEAHLGLGGVPPQSKAEAAVRVLASAPEIQWSTPQIGRVMVAQGWMDESDGEMASLASTLSRLVAEKKIFRPQRGQYQLAPPNQEGEA